MPEICHTSAVNGNLYIKLNNGTELFVNKSVLDGMTEEQINAMIDTWRTNNDVLRNAGIHYIEGKLWVWTGQEPSDWSKALEPQVPTG